MDDKEYVEEEIIDEDPDADVEDSYIQELKDACEDVVEADAIIWDEDDENLYMTITIGEEITDYTIPFEDLSTNIDDDIEYIVDAVNQRY